MLNRWAIGRWQALRREQGTLRAFAHVSQVLSRQIVGYALHSLAHRGTFVFEGKRYPYLIHMHNTTWENERTIEVPIVQRAVELAHARSARILEIGNVLSHYGPIDHDVLDKYESAPGLIGADVVDFQPEQRYDLIVSVSTLEHVGWDEVPREPEKFERAVLHLRSLLAPSGELIATEPFGHNSHVDSLFSMGHAPFDESAFMCREQGCNRWRECDATAIARARPWSENRSITVLAVCRAGKRQDTMPPGTRGSCTSPM